ncbi:phosphotransferase family protein [Mycobacterium branderi]|uniref:Acyl-CoA dehydrogenase n=1 Tax=Mycobacterium branderi TaxID=43348 RepID=A0A7I7WDJ9_9MYCO|nr:phosphotransferase family protein [Mycobacterium branderi]MCV7231742.1 phosphotransferase family protein [Mycobacterium branderi]ORA40291.1 hypothetical protein BST20_06995 [Mycobacterium branderi]BBZ15606.1 acyl-CoA dehydrogenase [Mycobacterium branderi]
MKLQQMLGSELGTWLSKALPESRPPWSCERIAGGYSMLTYRLTDTAGQCWVLRFPPAGNSSGRAHDTDREARMMNALHNSAVPVPTVRIVGTAEDPLGVPCHVTDFVPGHVLGDADSAARCLSPEAIRDASVNIVTALVELHAVDPDEVGLADFAPRANYLERQLRRWQSVLDAAAAPEVASLAADLTDIAEWLEAGIPSEAAPRIVHGDYRLGNAIVDDNGGIRALLDWELTTLGDPLADLGLLAAFWAPPPRAMLGVRMPTTAPGAIGVDEALELYAKKTGSDVDDFAFYRVFSAWRLACTAFRARARYASGAMDDSADTARFVDACTAWIEIAHQAMNAR